MNYEMFFYLIFYLSMQLWFRYRNIVCIGVLGILIIIGNFYTGDNAIILFWTGIKLADFIVGVILSMVIRRIEKTYKLFFHNKLIFWIVVGIIVTLLYTERLFLRDYSLGWNMILSLMVIVIAMLFRAESFPKLFVYLGDMSYSIYLMHFFVIGLAARLLIDNTVVSIKNTIIIIVAIIIAVFASSICYEIIEKRITKKLREGLY